MIVRIAVVAALVGLGVLLLWHPAPRPPVESASALAGPSATPAQRWSRLAARADRGDDLVVYVAGAVRTPGLYHLRAGDRVARAVALAGGMRASADAAAVNLAQRPDDGDEVYVPVQGEKQRHARSSRPRGRRRSSPPPGGSVDVNRARAAELAAVPGIGRAVAARIVELRQREGAFASLDELLDVAGMTQTRLERARPYLRNP
ncbi:MAG TPA: helix-hairpin-helix domain-containing protein [Candidatus Binatia bacterium]|nr:helix-hairpin-helix domain-containing protein [Candidatus Binatia bacterium]